MKVTGGVVSAVGLRCGALSHDTVKFSTVVLHSPEFWTMPAFCGEIKESFIYGLGVAQS